MTVCQATEQHKERLYEQLIREVESFTPLQPQRLYAERIDFDIYTMSGAICDVLGLCSDQLLLVSHLSLKGSRVYY